MTRTLPTPNSAIHSCLTPTPQTPMMSRTTLSLTRPNRNRNRERSSLSAASGPQMCYSPSLPISPPRSTSVRSTTSGSSSSLPTVTTRPTHHLNSIQATIPTSLLSSPVASPCLHASSVLQWPSLASLAS